MSDEPVLPHLEEDEPSPKSRPSLCSPRYMVPLCLILFAGIISAVIFLQPVSWFTTNPHPQDIAALKNQAAALTRRIDHLEAAEKTPLIDPEQIKTIEARITALHQQVEAIQNQPKIDAPPQQSERSLTLEKEVAHLVNTQKSLKAILLFWRLKAKVLSEAPYAAELTDFKTAMNEPEDLGILEKYADRGLQALKETPKALPSPSQNETGSWWDRLKGMANSFIRIEKVDVPLPLPSSFSQDRQAVEEALAQFDQVLTEQLTTISPTPSPLPGDDL